MWKTTLACEGLFGARTGSGSEGAPAAFPSSRENSGSFAHPASHDPPVPGWMGGLQKAFRDPPLRSCLLFFFFSVYLNFDSDFAPAGLQSKRAREFGLTEMPPLSPPRAKPRFPTRSEDLHWRPLQPCPVGSARMGHPGLGRTGTGAAAPEGCTQGPEPGEAVAFVPSAPSRCRLQSDPGYSGLLESAAEWGKRGGGEMGPKPRPGRSVSCCMSVTYSSISQTQSRPGRSLRSVCFFTNYCGPAALFVDTVVLKSANVHLSGGRARDSH